MLSGLDTHAYGQQKLLQEYFSHLWEVLRWPPQPVQGRVEGRSDKTS